MNANEQFDELVRRKLEERAIPFEESAWLDAEKAIRANKRERKGWLPYAAGAAVMIAVWLLWPNGQERITEQQGAKQDAVIRSAEHPAPEVQSAEPIESTEATSTHAAPVTQAHGAVTPVIVERSPVRNTANVREEHRTIEKRAVAEVERTAVVAEPQNEEAPGVEPTVWATNIPAQPEVAVEAAPTEVPSATPLEEPPAAVFGAEIEEPVVVTEVPADSAPEIAIALTEVGGTEKPSVVEPVTEKALDVAPAAIDGSEADETPLVVVAASEPPTSAPQDSLMLPPVPTAVPPPIVPANSPWEISLLGGLFSSTSQYGGGESAAWTVDRERTAGFGGEFMRMGRNIGVGLGVHYASYADRLSTPEVNSTSITYDPFWYLQAVDTTILIITGSFLDSLGNVVYTGQNVNTTVQVLRSSVDTISTTTRLREARERINRTNYIEVPLLFDAHLVQGRWSFGLRAGPSIGLLTTRQGSVPSDENDGDTELADMVLREYVFGWAARGYVSYRFNSAWSIGLEPALRGQLQDGLEKQLVSRQSSAYGCMLSLSYRLP